MPEERPARTPIALNRQARYDYFIDETVEAGIILTGTEVKSLRGGRATIGESYAGEQNGAIWLINAYIPAYSHAHAAANHEPRRPRKLLLRKREINRLAGLIRREGLTLIPLQLYFNPRGLAKLEIGVARGKKKYDKREAEKERDWKIQQQRLLRTSKREATD